MLWLETILFAAITNSQNPPPPKRFLYVPEGGNQEDGVVLRQIQRSELPPGEYEVVATFNGGGGGETSPSQSPFEDYRLQASESAGYRHSNYHNDMTRNYEREYDMRPVRHVSPNANKRRPTPMPVFENFPSRNSEKETARSAGFNSGEEIHQDPKRWVNMSAV